MKARGLLAACAATVVAVVAVSSCSTVSPEAARVGSTSIGQREFERDIDAFINNKAFLTRAATTFPGIDTAAHDGTVTADLTRGLLNLKVTQALVGQLAREKGITVTAPASDADVAVAYPFLDATTWAAMPAGFKARWANAAAEQLLVQNAINGPPPGDTEAQTFFEAVKDQVNGATFEQVRPQIMQRLRQQWNPPFQQAISDASAATRIRIDPRYGVWGPSGGVSALPLPLSGKDNPAPAAGAAEPSTTAPAGN